jgi:hypothetical protein
MGIGERYTHQQRSLSIHVVHRTDEARLGGTYIGSFKDEITIMRALGGFKASIYNRAQVSPVRISACKWTKERAIAGGVKGDGVVYWLLLNACRAGAVSGHGMHGLFSRIR